MKKILMPLFIILFIVSLAHAGTTNFKNPGGTRDEVVAGGSSDTEANGIGAYDGGSGNPGYLFLYDGAATQLKWYFWVDTTSGDLLCSSGSVNGGWAAPTESGFDDAVGQVVGTQS